MKQSRKNVLNTVGASGANVYTNDDAKVIVVCADNTASPLTALLEPIPYGSIESIMTEASQAEVPQLSIIGASTSKETIIASHRYKVIIASFNASEDSHSHVDSVHSYTAPAVLSGTAATDRANVYTVLASKINSYAKNNAKASTLFQVAFTLGGSVGDADANFYPGELVTQQSSGVTARVAKSVITSGTMAADNAAGTLWLYDVSNHEDFLATNRTLTAAGQSNCVVTQTNATLVKDVGIAVWDDAGYFTSSPERGGISAVYLDGFEVDEVEVARAGKYSRGIGTAMLAQAPYYNRDKKDLVSGNPEYEFPTAVVAGQTYTKVILNLIGKNKDALGPLTEVLPYQAIIYANESNATNLTNFVGALNTAKAK